MAREVVPAHIVLSTVYEHDTIPSRKLNLSLSVSCSSAVQLGQTPTIHLHFSISVFSGIMTCVVVVVRIILASSFLFIYASALVGTLQRKQQQAGKASSSAVAEGRRAEQPPSSSSPDTIRETRDIDSRLNLPFQIEYNIREALYSELPEIASLITFGFHPELNNNPFLRPIRVMLELDRLQNNFPYQDDRHIYLVCETKDKKVVGFCDVDGRIPMKKKESPFSPFASDISRPHPYFSDLTVNPNYRRRGIASALVEEGERLAKDMKCYEMYLGVSSTNTAALNLYYNMGYEVIVPTGDILEFVKRQKGVMMLRRTFFHRV
jgi:GNAT superfamily N-acetyltransferase